jgi:hypothetical protein
MIPARSLEEYLEKYNRVKQDKDESYARLLNAFTVCNGRVNLLTEQIEALYIIVTGITAKDYGRSKESCRRL